jgi:hypothetical protein
MILQKLSLNLCAKWFVIVWLNSIMGFLLGYNGQSNYLFGMVAGVMTWFVIYLAVDSYLLAKDREKLSKRLTLTAVLRVPLQITFYPDFMAGVVAMMTFETLGLVKGGFVEAYAMTLFTGFYLSLMCACIFAVISFVNFLKKSD